jgi:hypothetical protein
MVSRNKALQALHYAYPIVIFSYYSISSILGLIAVQRRHGRSKQVDLPVFAYRATLSCLALVLLMYFVQVTSVIIQLTQSHRWLENEHLVVSCLSCILVYGIQISQFYDDPTGPWTSFYGSWLLALPFEVLITALGITQERKPHLISTIFLPAIAYLRCGIVALLVGSPCLVPLFRKSNANNDEERQSLLAADALEQPSTPPAYGSTGQQEDDDSDTEEHRWERSVRLAKEAMEKRLQDDGGWFQYAMGFKVCNCLKRDTTAPLTNATSHYLHIPADIGVSADTYSSCVAIRRSSTSISRRRRHDMSIGHQPSESSHSTTDRDCDRQSFKSQCSESMVGSFYLRSATAHILRLWTQSFPPVAMDASEILLGGIYLACGVFTYDESFSRFSRLKKFL